MRFDALKVGELAKRTGLTVRTLHHYDDIGLLRPSLHTDSGHRLYTLRAPARCRVRLADVFQCVGQAIAVSNGSG